MKLRLVTCGIILSLLLPNYSVYADVVKEPQYNVLNMELETVSYTEMIKEVSKYFQKDYNFADNIVNKEATIKDFLLIFDAFSDMTFVKMYQNELIYVLENSYWLSAEEWGNISKNLDKPLTKDFMMMIFNRTSQLLEYSEELQVINNYEDYQKFIDIFMPKYSDLVKNNKEGVTNWLEPKDGSVRLVTDSKLGNILHEILHEDSIKRETSDYKRKESFSKKSIIMTGKPKVIYYYNHKTGEYACIDFIKNAPSSKIIFNNVPEDVQKTANYQSYFVGNSNGTAYAWGVYGMMQEYISYIMNINTNIVQSSVKYNDIDFNHANYLRIYLWEGVILEYLCQLEKLYPQIYDKIVADKEFISVILDTIDYAESRYILFEDSTTPIPGNIAAMDWCKSDKLVEQKEKLRNKLNEDELYEIVIHPTNNGSISVGVN